MLVEVVTGGERRKNTVPDVLMNNVKLLACRLVGMNGGRHEVG